MFERNEFLRPLAHRGLHDAENRIIENTMPAFEAALARNYGIDCDLQATSDGVPIVFHDATLDRLLEGSGKTSEVTSEHLKKLRYLGQDTRVATFAELLALVAGRVPLLVEIKSNWRPPDQTWLARICSLSAVYDGALALMSFDPRIMVSVRQQSPHVPRGIVSGCYRGAGRDAWWPGTIDATRAECLTYLLESGPVAPDFYAYEVRSLPTPVTRFVREVLGLPLLAWTVRSEDDRRTAQDWADAPIFEGYLP